MSAVVKQRVHAEPGEPFPGKRLATIGVICAFVSAPVALALCGIALAQSWEAGYKNYRAVVGLIVGAASLVVSVFLVIVLVASGQSTP